MCLFYLFSFLVTSVRSEMFKTPGSELASFSLRTSLGVEAVSLTVEAFTLNKCVDGINIITCDFPLVVTMLLAE